MIRHRFHRAGSRRSATPSTFVGQRPAPHTPADTAPRRELTIYENAHAAELVSWPFFGSYINKACDPKNNPIHHGARKTRGGVSVAIAGGIATGQTGGEENDKEKTDDKDEGVEDDKEEYNTMVAMVTIMTTIITTLLLACMSYVLRRE